MVETQKHFILKIITEIADLGEFDINMDPIASVSDEQELKGKLAMLISYYIDHDFEKLLWILYRIDVDEEKTKAILSRHSPTDAPAVLAELIIQRQLKKEEVKKQFESNISQAADDDDELRW